MRIQVLVENDRLAGRDDLVAEFGLSLLLEHGGRRILFDTGTSGVFADNAAAMGVDLAAVDLAVLSHRHFDHAGGLGRFLEANRNAPVYLKRCEPATREFRALGGILRKSIGLDESLLDRYPGRFLEIDEATEAAPGITLLTDMASSFPRPRGNRHLFEKRHGRLLPDPFDHELTMVVHEADGMIVITGCSHNGVLNMLQAAQHRFPAMPVKALVGGFHLIGLPYLNTMAGSRAEVEAIGREIAERCDGPVLTGHCTGAKAYAVLETVLGQRLRRFPTGTVLEV